MCDEDIEHDMPDGWWLCNIQSPDKSTQSKTGPCQHLLAALVHRNNLDVCKDPTDAGAGAPREIIWKKMKEGRVEAINVAKSGPQTERGKQEEAMLTAKALMMQKSAELEECQVVKEQLNMLKEFKESFLSGKSAEDDNGEKEYNTTVCDMLNELPIMKKRKSKGDSGKSIGSG
jgi:hypothetical protein